MAPKKGNDPPPAATPTADSTGLPVFSDEALAAESFSLEAPFEDELGDKLPVGLSAGMIQWRRPSEFLSELLVEPAEGVEAVMTKQGWASEVDVYATLEGLHKVLANTSYWAGAKHWKGQDTLTIEVDDQGNTGFSDGIVTVSASATVDVEPVASIPCLFVADAKPAETLATFPATTAGFWQSL